MGRYCLVGRVSVWEDEVDAGDDCTTTWMHLMLWKRTL